MSLHKPAADMFPFEGRTWCIISITENLYYRVLALPVNGGNTRWFSDNEIERINNEVARIV